MHAQALASYQGCIAVILEILPLLLVIKKPVYNLCSFQKEDTLNGFKNKLMTNAIQQLCRPTLLLMLTHNLQVQ